MNTKHATLFFVLLLFMVGHGKTQAQTLVITQLNGSKVYYNLDEEPKTTFTLEDLVIETQSQTVSYPLAQIKQFTYEQDATGIEEVSREGICISQNGDNIVITGLPNGKTIAIYNTNGQLLLTGKSDGSQRTTLSVHQLPIGVYVVKADQVTYKITKR